MKAVALVLLAAVAGCCSAPPPLPLPTVVKVENDRGFASAVPLSPTWLITARHVLPLEEVSGAKVVRVVEHPDPTIDLALVQIAEPMPWRCAVLAEDYPRFASRLVAIGWHLGEFLLATDGRQGAEPNSASFPIIFGASGGAVLDEPGRLVGVVASVSFMRHATGIEVPIFHLSHYTGVVAFRTWILSVIAP